MSNLPTLVVEGEENLDEDCDDPKFSNNKTTLSNYKSQFIHMKKKAYETFQINKNDYNNSSASQIDYSGFLRDKSIYNR
jgi:hypothetical protein